MVGSSSPWLTVIIIHYHLIDSNLQTKKPWLKTGTFTCSVFSTDVWILI